MSRYSENYHSRKFKSRLHQEEHRERRQIVLTLNEMFPTDVWLHLGALESDYIYFKNYHYANMRKIRLERIKQQRKGK